jgi:hypothetical protein
VKSAAERKADQRVRDALRIHPEFRYIRYSPGGRTWVRKKPKFAALGERTRRSSLFAYKNVRGRVIDTQTGWPAFWDMIAGWQPGRPWWDNPLYGKPKIHGRYSSEFQGVELERAGFDSKWQRATDWLNSEYTGRCGYQAAGGGATKMLWRGNIVSIDDYRRFSRCTAAPYCQTNVTSKVQPAEPYRFTSEPTVIILAILIRLAAAQLDINLLGLPLAIQCDQPVIPPYSEWYLSALRDACEKVCYGRKQTYIECSDEARANGGRQASRGMNLLDLAADPETEMKDWPRMVRELSGRYPDLRGYCCVSASGRRIAQRQAPQEMKMAA